MTSLSREFFDELASFRVSIHKFTNEFPIFEKAISKYEKYLRKNRQRTNQKIPAGNLLDDFDQLQEVDRFIVGIRIFLSGKATTDSVFSFKLPMEIQKEFRTALISFSDEYEIKADALMEIYGQSEREGFLAYWENYLDSIFV